MSLDKAIKYGKEHRKPYRGSKAFDPYCRNHGPCGYCEQNRKHKFRDKHPAELCEYDEAFTIQEMLEETGRCEICKLDCPAKIDNVMIITARGNGKTCRITKQLTNCLNVNTEEDDSKEN